MLIWNITVELRWHIKDAFGLQRVLQQKWVAENGEIKWVDVPEYHDYPQ